MGLEAVVDVQHEVEALCIELLGIVAEVIDTLVALCAILVSTIVAAALLVTACAYTGIVQNVGKRKVDAHGVMPNVDLLTYAGIQHETAILSSPPKSAVDDACRWSRVRRSAFLCAGFR